MNPTVAAVESLERRVNDLLTQYLALRAENVGLRTRLLEAQSDRERLQQVISASADYLEILKERLPADALR